MIYPAAFLGDFTQQRTSLIAIIPEESKDGAQVRAVHVLAGEYLQPDTQNYWLMQVGKLSTGTFKVLAPETAFQGGFPAEVARRIAFDDPLLLKRGENLAVRMCPRGQPAPLVGLSIAIEWGILSVRSAARP